MRQTIEIHEKHYLPHQWAFLRDLSRTLGLVGGLGSGKTVAFIAKALVCLISRPGANRLSNVGIGYPTYDMGRTLFFYPFCEHLEMMDIPFNANLSRLEITTEYGSVKIKSVNDPEKIIGETFTDAGLDEIDTLPMPKGLRAVARFRERLRGRKDSQLFMVSSPEGFSTCYEVLQNSPNPGTSLIRAKTTDNVYLSHGYIDNIRAAYDPAMVRAYINGEFVNLNSMQAHYSFDRAKHVQPVPRPTLGMQRLQIGLDFNVDPLCACVGYWDGDTLLIFDEYYLRNSNTYQIGDLIYNDWHGWDLTIYPDPTGTARKTSSDTSDIKILMERGFDVQFRSGVTQKHSLNIANGEFAHDRIIIDPKCKRLIDDLEQTVTDEYGLIEKPSGTKLTHMSDAMRNILNNNKITRPQWRVA